MLYYCTLTLKINIIKKGIYFACLGCSSRRQLYSVEYKINIIEIRAVSALDTFFTFFFPLLLLAGTAMLGYKELRAYIQAKESGRLNAPFIQRLIRRGAGLIMMFTIGIMIYIGMRNAPPTMPSLAYMKFWLICITLVVGVLLLAIWDAICEIKKIKQYIQEFHTREVQDIKKKFKIYTN